MLTALLIGATLLATTAIAEAVPTFTKYRIPNTLSARGSRDLEFHWSSTYTDLGVTLVPNINVANDLSRLGNELSDVIGLNPLGYANTDIQLAWDFFHANRSALYNWASPGSDPFLLNPAIPNSERNHIDTYVYMPGYASDPPFPPNPNGDFSSGNPGMYPSAFTSPDEDITSTVYHQNALMIPGPRPSLVGNTGPNSWPRQLGGAVSNWIHEFQHLMNGQELGGNPYSELFSEAAQVMTGGAYQELPLQFDVPYTWSLLRSSHYAGWRQLAAYLALQFKGTNPSAREDDLWYRWGGASASSRTFGGLVAKLSDAECTDCVTKPYFVGIPNEERVRVMLQNFRVAAYVNNTTLGNGQYGFPIQGSYNFAPSVDVGAWQNVDGAASDDNVALPAHLTADPTWRTREYTTRVHPAVPGQYASRPLELELYGAEYFVIHPAASLGTGGDTLVVRASTEGLVRSDYQSISCGPVVTSGGKMYVSVVNYSVDSNTLYLTPQHATGVQTASVEVDSVARDIELVVTGFGSTTKSVLVVVSLLDGAGMGFSSDPLMASGLRLPIRLSGALRKAPFLATNPVALAQTTVAWDDYPTWSPDGAYVAFHSRIPSSAPYNQVYRVPIGGGAATVISAQATGQLRPDWSPRGDAIAWEQDNGAGQTDIWVANPLNGSGAHRLTFHTGFAVNAAFGITGQQLAYFYKSTTPNTPWELWRINLDGTADTRVAVLTSDASPGSLRWAPNGQSLYFTRNDSLYAVLATGGTAFSRTALAPGVRSFDFDRGNGPIAVETRGKYSFNFDRWCGLQFGLVDMPWSLVGTRDSTVTPGDTRHRFSAPGVAFNNPRYSFDGTRIAYSADPNTAGNRDLFYGSITYNHAPTFTNGTAADAMVPTCVQWNRTLTATDRDGETVTFSAPQLPPGASWVSGNRIRWTPSNDQIGDYYIVVRAQDASGGVDNKVMKVTIYDAGLCGQCPPEMPNCYPELRHPGTELPLAFALGASEPNPAGDGTVIRFAVPRREHVQIDVVDIQGRLVRRLVDGGFEAGYQSVRWDRKDQNSHRLGAGVYFYRMRAGAFTERRKLTLLP
ncbi:MAG: T9SS type A sorting domain-containing protein [Candidatus Eisenbacteria bacterium]|uniref:T9SS type A sorting domain-containing protein n=1 Tax=Eiseniibacteriota bacterium TaxID=2212470 RepID=A0A849SQC5_UNCEI|nr:T9SS type A sorting domain-containing protein [Candidatus Eisenbacteria bacterium]